MMRILSVMAVVLVLGLPSVKGAEQVAPANLARAARAQIGITVSYDSAYRALEYPNGDVPMATGVCTDVVVRALRTTLGMDLQRLVHEDMRHNFSRYPQNWGLSGPDKNIDHRRVPNLQTYFRRKGWQLPISKDPRDYQAGDLVTCIVPPRLPHIMIVSDRTNAAARPLVIHNIGAGTQEEDRLFEFEITGHYRVSKPDRSSTVNNRRSSGSRTNPAASAADSGR